MLTHHSSAWLLILSVVSTCALAELEPSNSSFIREQTKSAISAVISVGKDIMGGVSEGVLDGRHSAQGTDGATSISSHTQMAARVEVQLLTSSSDMESARISLGFKNATDTQLRLINLKESGALLAIDNAGYASALKDVQENPAEITIPANTSVRQAFIFEAPDQALESVRLWGEDYRVR